MTQTKPSQVEMYGELLTVEQQFHQDVAAAHVVLTRDEEQAFLLRAQAGEQEARNRLIESCLPYIMHLAGKYSNITQAIKKNHYIEYLDLVQLGSVIVAERFDRALTKPNPMGYLRTAVSGLMCAYIKEHADGIKITRTRKNEKNGVSFHLVSLDAPVVENSKSARPTTYADILPAAEPVQGERDYRPLHEAIDGLTELQQEIVTASFGLGRAPESLTDIMNRHRQAQGKACIKGQGVSTSSKRKALSNLKKVLAPVYALA